MSEVVYGGPEPLELDALAVFSHPDDAELTCAGTLLKLKSLGRSTGVVDATRGEMGTRGTPEQRFEEAREAARIMRLDVRVNLAQPDGHVFVTDEARTALVRVIRTHRPKVILTAHWDDPHPDHAATARLAREAGRRPRAHARPRRLLAPRRALLHRGRLRVRRGEAPRHPRPPLAVLRPRLQ